MTNAFWTTIARGAEDVAQSAGYSVLLCNSDENPDKQESYLQAVLSIPWNTLSPDTVIELNAIRRACASGASVAMVSRGGYGLSRLLPHLPYKELDKAVAKGTRFVGLSDFTALQLALAFPAASGGAYASFEAFAAVFAITQVPLAAVEGAVTALMFKYIVELRSDVLVRMNVVSARAIARLREAAA